jgi:hypothetical protein
VRIPVAVDSGGSFRVRCLNPEESAGYDDCMNDWDGEGGKHRVIVEADLPLPAPPPVVKGRVKP